MSIVSKAHGYIKPVFSLIVALFAISIVSGCGAMYPIQKGNILTSPVHINVRATDGVTVKPIDDYTTDMLIGLDYTLDNYATSKAKEYIADLYRKNYERKEIDPKARINEALRNALSQTNAYIDVNDAGKKYTTASKMDKFKIDWSGDIGIATANIQSYWNHGGLYFNGDTNIELQLKLQQTESASIQADITSISYVIKCMYGSNRNYHVACMFKPIELREQSLISLVDNANSSPRQTTSAEHIKKQLVSYLERRYVAQEGIEAPKIEKTYHIDFATAKSRLQRVLGSFKYDNEKSSFIFENKFSNPVSSNPKKVTHRYVLSLFPDRNETVIVFSGDYQYFEDSFGGERKFSGDVFKAEVLKQITTVDKVLQK